MKMLFAALLCAILVLSAQGSAISADLALDKGVKEFVSGVYWPWERTPSIVKNAGMEKWAFVESTCKLLAENGTNAIWLVNIDLADTLRLAQIAGPMGIKLLSCLGEIAPQNCRGSMGLDPDAADFKEKALEYYKKTVPKMVGGMGEDKKYILAWVMCDEPTGVYMELMEPLRQIFAEVDPEREAIAVTMWPQTPELIAKTKINTFCVDVYPFFGDGNPNGPHTPEASRNFLTYNAERMTEQAGYDGRIGWVMAQCFADVWGPYKLNDKGSMIGLPGSFIHWRAPSVSEMRWQIWESLRVGAKGILFYTYLGVADSDTKAKSPTDPSMATRLLKKEKEGGVSGLLDQYGRPTAQFKEMSAIYKKLKPHHELLRRLVPIRTSWLSTQSGLKVTNFVDPQTQRRYAIVVNPDFKKSAKGNLTASLVVAAVTDVISGRKLEMASLGWAGGNSEARIELAPGEGKLLRIGN